LNPVSTLATGQRELAKLDFTQAEVDELKAKLMTLTRATLIVRSPERDELGRIKYVEVPNVGIQLAATVKALEFGVGKARQMIEVTGGGSTGQNQSGVRDLAKLMHEQPELADKVIRALKDGLNPAQTIDVTPVKSSEPAQASESNSAGSTSGNR
jgi:hypothetical protein